MARKSEEKTGGVADWSAVCATPRKDVEEAILREQNKTLTMSAMIELPVIEPVGHYSVNFNFNVTAKLAKRVRMLRDSLHQSGERFDDGSGSYHVDSDGDVFRWLLAQCDVA